MRVGLSLPVSPGDGDATWTGIRQLAALAEAGGADSLWVPDHFLDRRQDHEAGLHEPFTMLAAVAAATTTIQLGPLVAALSFRSPGLLAKTAATLDVVSQGRLILGVGCGWHEPEYRAFGYPFDHRVGRFEEGVAAVRALLDGERVTVRGRWTVLDDAVLLPPPERRIPFLVAAEGPRMLRLTARYGDAWHVWDGLPCPDSRLLAGRLAEACELEGRAQLPDLFARFEAGPASEEHVSLDAVAVEDALAAWQAEGIVHVVIGAWPATAGTWEPVLEGIRRFREGAARR